MDDKKEGISVLQKCQEAAELLEKKIVEYHHEPEIQTLSKDLATMRVRITKLLTQAQQGVETIQEAKDEQNKREAEIQTQNETLKKVDDWLTDINEKITVPQKDEQLSEKELVYYIEIFEKYLSEYYLYEELLTTVTTYTTQEEKVKQTQKLFNDTKDLIVLHLEQLRKLLDALKEREAEKKKIAEKVISEPQKNIDEVIESKEKSIEATKVPEELPKEEAIDDDFPHSDRTIDSSSMPEEIVSPRLIREEQTNVPVKQIELPSSPVRKTIKETSKKSSEPGKSVHIIEVETQTGKSLASDILEKHDVSITCEPYKVETQDVSITCAPPNDVQVQTNEDIAKEMLQNIEVRQTSSEGHDTIEIASRPVVSNFNIDDKSLLVDAKYKEVDKNKDTQLNIVHSLPQSFETVMVEPDETTTEVIVDADGTKRIIVRRVRKTLVTRHERVQTQQKMSQILTGGVPENESYSQIVLHEDKGTTSTTLGDGGVQHVQYQTYGGQVISGLPGGEVTIQEFTSRPDVTVRVDGRLEPEELLAKSLAVESGDDGHIHQQIRTSSSSVTAVVQQVTKRIVKTRRRIIKRIVIIDGKEHVTEEIIDEPDNIEVYEEQIPKVSITVRDHGGVNISEVDDKPDNDGSGNPDSQKDFELPHKDEKDDKDLYISKNQSQKLSEFDKEPVIEEPQDFQPTDGDTNQPTLIDITKQLLESENEHSSVQIEDVTKTKPKRTPTPVSQVKGKTDDVNLDTNKKDKWSDKVSKESVLTQPEITGTKDFTSASVDDKFISDETPEIFISKKGTSFEMEQTDNAEKVLVPQTESHLTVQEPKDDVSESSKSDPKTFTIQTLEPLRVQESPNKKVQIFEPIEINKDQADTDPSKDTVNLTIVKRTVSEVILPEQIMSPGIDFPGEENQKLLGNFVKPETMQIISKVVSEYPRDNKEDILMKTTNIQSSVEAKGTETASNLPSEALLITYSEGEIISPGKSEHKPANITEIANVEQTVSGTDESKLSKTFEESEPKQTLGNATTFERSDVIQSSVKADVTDTALSLPSEALLITYSEGEIISSDKSELKPASITEIPKVEQKVSGTDEAKLPITLGKSNPEQTLGDANTLKLSDVELKGEDILESTANKETNQANIKQIPEDIRLDLLDQDAIFSAAVEDSKSSQDTPKMTSTQETLVKEPTNIKLPLIREVTTQTKAKGTITQDALLTYSEGGLPSPKKSKDESFKDEEAKEKTISKDVTVGLPEIKVIELATEAVPKTAKPSNVPLESARIDSKEFENKQKNITSDTADTKDASEKQKDLNKMVYAEFELGQHDDQTPGNIHLDLKEQDAIFVEAVKEIKPLQEGVKEIIRTVAKEIDLTKVKPHEQIVKDIKLPELSPSDEQLEVTKQKITTIETQTPIKEKLIVIETQSGSEDQESDSRGVSFKDPIPKPRKQKNKDKQETQDVEAQQLQEPFKELFNPIPGEAVKTLNIKAMTSDEFLMMERLGYDKPVKTLIANKEPEQTVEIKMSISKTEPKLPETIPHVAVQMKVEGFTGIDPKIVKKEIDVGLPSVTDITTVGPPVEPIVEIAPTKDVTEPLVVEVVEKDPKKRKRKKHKRGSESESATPSQSETDKSINITESGSSSLSHYVELPASSHGDESPKPTEPLPLSETDQAIESPILESERAVEEIGYEAEEISATDLVPADRPKAKRRHKQKISEETTYPKVTTAESEETTIATPVEMAETPKAKPRKKSKSKKAPIETADVAMITSTPEVSKAESPLFGKEETPSLPGDESYHTISDNSEVTTIKIVEECVHSSPEAIQRDDVVTTITYPVPVVEAVYTQEYSIQTSPDLSIVSETAPEVQPRPESVDAILQTSPTQQVESSNQTSPVDDKEISTQTIDEPTAVVKSVVIPQADDESQTSLLVKEVQPVTEASTQVVGYEIYAPDNKSAQTSPIQEDKPKSPEENLTAITETESREIQTSPIEKVASHDKDTETLVITSEIDVQTPIKELKEQDTSTSPIRSIQVEERSIQTPDITLVSTDTQVEIPEEDDPKANLEITFKPEVETVDSSQQTTPREAISIDTQVELVAEAKPNASEPEVIIPKPIKEEEVILQPIKTDYAQQTSPRDAVSIDTQVEFSKEESPKKIGTDVVPKPTIQTSEMAQQTSPRETVSENETSTSTDEPYEVHLRAQISVPRATNDFLENERSLRLDNIPPLERPKSRKHKKQKNKPETYTAATPESLSDPITTELSFSLTPTSSEELTSRDTSLDEGISPENKHRPLPKMTYSDVVRAKSKSPDPAVKDAMKSRLLASIKKRTKGLTDNQTPKQEMSIAILEPSVEKSYEIIVNQNLEEAMNAIRTNTTSTVERSTIIVIETISVWLEEIHYRIQTIRNASEDEIDPHVLSENNTKIKKLRGFVNNLKSIKDSADQPKDVIELVEVLEKQINAVDTLNRASSNSVKEAENDWNRFIKDVNALHRSIENAKLLFDEVTLSDLPTQEKLDRLDKIESENIENIQYLTRLFQKYRNLVEKNASRDCPQKLFICDDDTKQIENSIIIERERLLQLASLAEEYEQTLQDFGQITDVAEALLDGKIIVSNLDHLHEEIQKHRKFFVNLSHCRAILESLEDNLDVETRSKFSALHNSLHDRATVIIDRAAGRAQQMTLAASRWTTLEQGMKEEQQWLRVAHQRIPDLTNVTSIDHEQYINLYQSISLDVSHHHAKLLRLLSLTESVQNLILCHGMETECTDALDALVKLQEDIEVRLTRLSAFKENWLTYDHLVDRIEGWMKIANREIQQISPDSVNATGNLRRFWELKAQHEVHNNLKNNCGNQFEKALQILPISDEMVQRQFFSKVEDEWCNLSKKIDTIHQAAIQNISDKDVSSNEKLNILEEEIKEVKSFVDGLKGVLKSEDELNLYIERLQVMNGRIDRIQNELGRLSLLPTQEPERLTKLLSQSRILESQISEELERSLLLKEKIIGVQAGIARCRKNQSRARLTLEECEASEKMGSDVVEKALFTCEKLETDLQGQWQDILALRQALHTLPTSLRACMSPTQLEREISSLQETHAALEGQCGELSARLRARMQLWRRFERQLELVQGAVREADYMVELLTVQGQVDYDRLLKATEKLEGLNESLSTRGGALVGELKAAAAPLAGSCDSAVAAQLQKDLDDATANYEHTCQNLTQLCDKYHRAVKLWSQYREAAAALRAWTDMQEGRLHSLRPDDATAQAQACSEQEARVTELRALAERVAAETGSKALQADADTLGRRLAAVCGAVRALADVGEARQRARARAAAADKALRQMHNDLATVDEDTEIAEETLIALRDNLIALGKSEGDIAPAKAELPAIDRDVSHNETPIVKILELWQEMFKDTFLHYHRLSTTLIRSGDATTALRLWHEYLLDLQSFLSGGVPEDYENLTENRHLCKVHRNLLSSQRSVLLLEGENRDRDDEVLSEKFNILTNLHNETLARIVDRHDEVSSRIAAWEDYRDRHANILKWLKEMEREKEKLQLRYVHIKRISKILARIQGLFDKIPTGRKQCEKLFDGLKKVMVFTDEAYGASVRMEYAGIVKRVDNLHASLETWRDFLTRILDLIGEHDKLVNDLQKKYSDTQSSINTFNNEDRLSRPQVRVTIEKYTDLRKSIEKTENQLEALSVIQEQLKECLSPQDIRVINQKIWQLRQQKSDLEHQLSIIIHRLQERIETYSIFESRLTRFSEWVMSLEQRFERTSQGTEVGALDPQDLIRKINSDIEAETSMKEREFDWLISIGMKLVDLSRKDERQYSEEMEQRLRDVQDRWYLLLETGRSRVIKITELLYTIAQLEERLSEIRSKLHEIESRLTLPVVLEQLNPKSVDEKAKIRDEIQKSIEKESSEVGETLNLCELIFNDSDIQKGNFDLRNLKTGVDIVEKKWRILCDMSNERKNTFKDVRKASDVASKDLSSLEKRLDKIEKRVEKVEARKNKGESDQDKTVAESITKDLDAMEDEISHLDQYHTKLTSAKGVELIGKAADDAGRLRKAVNRWRQLCQRIRSKEDAQAQFVEAHGRAVVALAQADVQLTRALHLAPATQDLSVTLKDLDAAERETIACKDLVASADRLGEAALASHDVTDVEGTNAMMQEYRALYNDVITRLKAARNELDLKAKRVADVDSAVQVDTLKFETDAALQVDTLTARDAYRAELETAVQDAQKSLNTLQEALQQPLPEGASGEDLAAAAKSIARAGSAPTQPLELAKHLSELLLTECDAGQNEALLPEVEGLALKYEELLGKAKQRELQITNLSESGKITCPLCSERNWKQLDNDLWRLEQWLQYAEATDQARGSPPDQYDALEDAIQEHREFLLDLDSHKSLVVSLNVVGAHVAQHAASARQAHDLRARLQRANTRWDQVCERATRSQRQLQQALLHNRQFHDIVVELVERLAVAERKVRAREPLRLRRSAEELSRDFRRFGELRDELEATEPRVHALHDAAQLLRTGDAPHNGDDICRRLSELRLRLQSLRKLCGIYALKLGAALAKQPSSGLSSALAAVAGVAGASQLLEEEEDLSKLNLPPIPGEDATDSEESEEEVSGLRRGLRFVCRVARASLPFQALLLLLLGAAALGPSGPDSTCRTPTHLEPVLRYPDGPPPM